ncbi:MAG: AhpC/TSA family protein [Bacteroidetes bacterium]|nr:AhpC/TSA family protein [Bacteroidota bacterium]
MKKFVNLSFFSGIIFLMTGCGQNPTTGGYTINGTIKGVDSGLVKLVKFNQDDRTTATIDSVKFNEGKFELKGKLESPEMMSVTIEPGNWSFPVFVENSKITVTADTTGSEHFDWSAYGGSVGAEMKTFTVSGSNYQDELKQYDQAPSLKVFEPTFKSLKEAYSTASAQKNKDEVNRVKDEMDSVRGLLNALQIKWIDSFVSKNPSSAAGAYMLNQYYMYKEDYPLKDMQALMAKFTGAAKSTVYFDILKRAADKRAALQPGNSAPDFTALKRDSSKFTLSSLKGQYVMLDFWASWCVPCRKAIPHWKEVYAKYHDKGFEILSVTNDSRWKEWFKALDEEKMPWLQVADDFPVKNMPARIAELYMTPYLPTYILLDKDGKIILHNGTEQQIDDRLKEIFGN